MLIRIWYVQHTLTEKEELRLRMIRQNPQDHKLTVRYRRRKKKEDVEAESIHDAVLAVSSVKEEIEDMPGVFRHYRAVFAAAEATEGEMCAALEDYFEAQEELLPLE